MRKLYVVLATVATLLGARSFGATAAVDSGAGDLKIMVESVQLKQNQEFADAGACLPAMGFNKRTGVLIEGLWQCMSTMQTFSSNLECQQNCNPTLF